MAEPMAVAVELVAVAIAAAVGAVVDEAVASHEDAAAVVEVATAGAAAPF